MSRAIKPKLSTPVETPFDGVVAFRALALTTGSCMARGCRYCLTPGDRLKRRAHVIVVKLDGHGEIRLCPEHARTLEVRLHRTLLGSRTT